MSEQLKEEIWNFLHNKMADPSYHRAGQTLGGEFRERWIVIDKLRTSSFRLENLSLPKISSNIIIAYRNQITYVIASYPDGTWLWLDDHLNDILKTVTNCGLLGHEGQV